MTHTFQPSGAHTNPGVDWSQAGAAAGSLFQTGADLIRQSKDGYKPPVYTPPVVEEDEGPGAEPWILGGIAVVGILAVAWAFWPRD
jgi:hypothetical protein